MNREVKVESIGLFKIFQQILKNIFEIMNKTEMILQWHRQFCDDPVQRTT